MCGRFTLRNTKKIKEDFGVEREPSFNISPGQSILTVHKKIEIMRWYFNPEWAKKPMNLINARSETLHEKPSFRDARRCVIPVDGWYEWFRQDGKKKPYFFHNNNDLFLFAAIYSSYKGENGCALVTKNANDNLQRIHHRMPILLSYKEAKSWINGDENYNSELSELTEFYPVSDFVNSPGNNNEICIESLN